MIIHAGHFEVPLALLRELLQLPAEAAVRVVAMDISDSIENFTVVVEHPDLPGIDEGERAPEISPVWEREEDGGVRWHVIGEQE